MNAVRTIFPCWNNGKKSYTDGGRVQCDVCGSFEGVISKNYYRTDRRGNGYLKRFTRCVKCRSLEVTNNTTGKILRQDISGVAKKERKTSEWINAVLQNDETSTDDELTTYFRQNGLSPEDITKIISQRQKCLADPFYEVELENNQKGGSE